MGAPTAARSCRSSSAVPERWSKRRAPTRRGHAAHARCSSTAPSESSPPGGRPVLALGLTIEDDKITLIDVIADPARLNELDLAMLVD
jgi:hypothetical protein